MAVRPVVVYNVQRLFRPGGSRIARALDATAEKGWTAAVYRRKVAGVGAMLSSATGGTRPALLVLIEVEDAVVVADVCAAAGWPELVDVAVPNERMDGYDVAIAYDPATFGSVSDQRSFTFENRFATRDLLVATLHMDQSRALTVLASHWASRSISNAEILRVGAAIFCTNILERLVKFGKEDTLRATGRPRLPSRPELAARWSTPILFAGDVNDNPWDRSVGALLDSTPELGLATRPPRFPLGQSTSSVAAYLRLRPRLYNPTWQLLAAGPGEPRGTYRYSGDWYSLDQFLVSAGMLDGNAPALRVGSLRAHGPKTVTLKDGTIVQARAGDGSPIAFKAETRTGISDHLPLVAELDL
jgi:hypothetical protein